MKTRSHRWAVPDGPSLRRLLDHCCQHITEQDIRDHVPNDPGYLDYIRALSQVLEIGRVPQRATFDIVESISLTNWGEAERERHPERFRRFRCFTCAMGVALLATGHHSETVCAPNYLLFNLVRDAEDLGDRVLQSLLPEAFESLHAVLAKEERQEVEHPFCLLASVLVRLGLGEEPASVRSLAARLIAEEQAARRMAFGPGKPFLLGVTAFDQFHRLWRKLVCRRMPADTSVEELLLIRAEFC